MRHLLSLFLLTAIPAMTPAQQSEERPYGKLPDGTQITEHTLKNKAGMTAKIITYGGILTSLTVPDKDGKLADVVLGCDSLEGYLKGHPFFGAITSGVLSGATIPAHRLLRPYPHFVNMNLPESTPGASASFNALVAKITKQFGAGLTLLSSYQWSKAIDDASETQGWELAEAFRDYYNQSIERSISGHDVPHSWVTSLVYELPVGKGKRFGPDMHPVADAILGGWQVSTITRFSSGLPLQVTAANNLAPYGFAVQRPNIANLKDLEISNRSPERWFNTSAFTAPAAFTVGSAPRWFPNLRFDKARYSDFAIMKNFRYRERIRTQFRAEFFNITNTPQFGRADTNQASPSFGSISSTINPPRNVQLGLKIDF
jgi:hypothetical protein